MAAGLRSLGTWTSTLRGRDQYRGVSNTTTRLATKTFGVQGRQIGERLQDLTKLNLPAHALTIQHTTSKTHLTNRNTETSAARLAALGEPIDYDYDYRSEFNEQGTNHRGA